MARYVEGGGSKLGGRSITGTTRRLTLSVHGSDSSESATSGVVAVEAGAKAQKGGLISSVGG